MNDAAKKWVTALRSGKYKQAKGRLRKGDGYCCLGVACVVLGHHLSSESKLTSLPDSIKRELGLSNNEGKYFLGRGDFTYLAVDNDLGRKTFAEIADIIESEPEGLFQ